ncbi:adenosylcobinamide amidohydrolase [Xanthobacter sp. V4C-4]|uniref:adenosylcobinamide amidohydrolase n=1 Tax=Xanthobacter cornucopiae TaxID=3119924 RepID=UPI00372C3B03
MTGGAGDGLFRVEAARPLLVARFAAPQRMVSWSINRPGFVTGREVAWLEVRNRDLTPDLDVLAWFRARLEAAGLGAAVGLMTSRNVDHHHLAWRGVEGVAAACLVTLGLNNGERVGARFSPAAAAHLAGTVNILAAVSVPLTEAALLEASSVVVQARTRAILEADFRREGLPEPVSGTGTDCVVMSAPAAGPAQPYAGLHTAVGEAVGAAALAATRAAVAVWLADPARLVT